MEGSKQTNASVLVFYSLLRMIYSLSCIAAVAEVRNISFCSVASSFISSAAMGLAHYRGQQITPTIYCTRTYIQAPSTISI